MPELTQSTPSEAFRLELCRPRIQVPLWVTIFFAAAGVVCSTWSWATSDSRTGLAGIAAWALFIPSVLFLERAVSRIFRETLSSKDAND